MYHEPKLPPHLSWAEILVDGEVTTDDLQRRALISHMKYFLTSSRVDWTRC